MNEKEMPQWLRIFQIIVGIIAVGLGLYVLLNPGPGLFFLVFLLAVALIVLGINRIIFGISAKVFPGWVRGVSLVAGIIILLLGLYVAASPATTLPILIFLLALALLIYGVERIFMGAAGKEMGTLDRMLCIGIGLFNVVFAAIVIFHPLLGLLGFIAILAFILIISGVGGIVSGLTGAQWSGLSRRTE